MSSLKKSLDAQRASAPVNPCYAVIDQAPTLSVVVGEDEWIFSWVYFTEAKRSRANAGEAMTLFFSRSKVLICGHNLTLLAHEIRRMRLDQISVVPREYDQARGETVINKITIEPIKEKKDKISNGLSDAAHIELADDI